MQDKKIKRKPGDAVDWTDIPLGTDTDAAIGRTYGLKAQTVANARRSRGIDSYIPRSKSMIRIDWDNEPRLGKMPDRMLQRILKIGSSASVTLARQRRGIPKFTRPDATDTLLLIWDLQSLVEGSDAGSETIDVETLRGILGKHNLLPKEKKN